MWQKLYGEVGALGLLPITVAFDVRGAEVARPYIEAAKATYPCLIDRTHRVAELYNMVNVPQAVWIDEEGRIVRPTETAGTGDAFRSMDRTTGAMDPEQREDLAAKRASYLDALRDWAANGAQSRFVLSGDAAVERVKGPTAEHAQASAWFRLGEHLHEQGHEAAAQRAFDEAKRLRPESWAFRRQAWNLEHELKSGGPEFWAAVEALGDEHYYEPFKL
ncbi:hypothetical protein AYO38_05515 [bacterium SCGC AG-212-C10]|nr:hypothetical protein AYO38_05515 [bacterium SCGC AG-212-C10]